MDTNNFKKTSMLKDEETIATNSSVPIIRQGKPQGKPYVCPVCNGRGLVSSDYYDTNDWQATYKDTRTIPEQRQTCRACGGIGVLWGN